MGPIICVFVVLWTIWHFAHEGYAFGVGRPTITAKTFWIRFVGWMFAIAASLTLLLMMWWSVDLFGIIGAWLLVWSAIGYGWGRLWRGRQPVMEMLYANLNGNAMGPYSWSTVQKLWKTRKIGDDTLVRVEDDSDWTPMRSMRERLKK